MEARARQIRIKAGSVRRLWREAASYRQEAITAGAKLEAGRAEGKSDVELKQLGALLQEALLMVPDSTRRLTRAQGELKNYLESEQDLKDNPEYISAAKILEESLADVEENKD